MAEECQGKSSWPELLGVVGQLAKTTIESENPLVQAIIAGPDTVILPVFLCDRVVIWVNADGIVIQVPRVG